MFTELICDDIMCVIIAKYDFIVKMALFHVCKQSKRYDLKIDQYEKYVVCQTAVRRKWTNILKWARKQECSWNELTCTCATMNEHLETLKWAKNMNVRNNTMRIFFIISQK